MNPRHTAATAGLSSRSPGRAAPEFVVQRAHEQNVAAIELWVSDALGALHVIEVPRESLEDTLADGFFAGPALSAALSPTGERAELYLAPDPMTFQHVSRQRRSARLICDVQHADGSPWPLCVRSRLKRVLGRIAADGATFYLGATSTHRWLAAPLGPTPLIAPHLQQQLAEETARGLDSLSIPWRSHRRVAGEPRDPSRWLFELDLVDPLTLADSLVSLRRLAETCAHGCATGATWMPHPWEGVRRASLDLTLTRLSSMEGPPPTSSLRAAPPSTLSDPLRPDGLSLTARAIAQALSGELGPLSLILRGTVNSYTRPDPIAIEASPMSRSDTGAALWLAGADACANPYLVAAALVAIAHDGALRAAQPAENTSVPQTLVEAARLAESSSALGETLGPELLRGLVVRAREDAARWRGQVTPFEVERYL